MHRAKSCGCSLRGRNVRVSQPHSELELRVVCVRFASCLDLSCPLPPPHSSIDLDPGIGRSYSQLHSLHQHLPPLTPPQHPHCRYHDTAAFNMAKVLQAKVKSVLSGDTLVLASPQDSRNERILSFAFVNAPRVRREGDEPFGYASRQFLIENLVGKLVQFKVLYTIPTGAQRDMGTVRLQDGRQFPHESVSNGWLRVREDAGRKEQDEASQQVIDELQLAEARAKADNKGLWTENKSSGDVEVSYNLDDPQTFVDQHKGKDLKGQVEKVISGDRVILRLLLSPSSHIQTIVLLAGIRAPSTKRTTDDKNVPAEPFGEEAALYLTDRILLRTLDVQAVGVSPNGQLIARIVHPAGGDMSENLLKNGLAQCTDHHSTMLGTHMSKLRQAEKSAKGKQLNLFQGHVVKAAGGESEVIVSRVLSADTIFVRTRNGPEQRIALSSVRGPKSTDPKQSPWQDTAKEFMRSKLIGKHVKISIDGKKPATDGYEEREVATVMQGGKNIAIQLVEAGYASVIRHRRDDPDRSPLYDELLQAEQAATTAKKGIFSDKSPAAKSYQDYSESLQKAKMQASVLSKQKRINAIVDFVKGPSRFTILIPRENAKLTLVLSCIRAPKSARPGAQGEPFGAEAHEFATRRLQQRDVEIDIEGTDKLGGFIGTLYIGKENFTKLLLEEGFASVHAYSAEKDVNGAEYFAAESKAQEARKNIWKDYVPEEEDLAVPVSVATENTNGSAQERRRDYKEVMITHISPEDARLKVQIIGTGTGALTELMSRFSKFHLSNQTPIKDAPKVGDIVSAKFSADDTWYRAKIRRNDRDAKVSDVVYIDYGNSEQIPWGPRLRPLADQFSTSSLKAQAHDAQFAFIQFPVNKDYLDDAINFLYQEVGDKSMVANVEHAEKDGTLHITLFHKDLDRASSDDKSVNADLVSEGLAFVPRKVRAWERGPAVEAIFKNLKAKEEQASREHRGLWEYGDALPADD